MSSCLATHVFFSQFLVLLSNCIYNMFKSNDFYVLNIVLITVRIQNVY